VCFKIEAVILKMYLILRLYYFTRKNVRKAVRVVKSM